MKQIKTARFRTAETLDEAEHRLDMLATQQQVKLLMKLNKEDLRVLGAHYNIAGLQIYFDDGWAHGGKLELCLEIAERMEG